MNVIQSRSVPDRIKLFTNDWHVTQCLQYISTSKVANRPKE